MNRKERRAKQDALERAYEDRRRQLITLKRRRDGALERGDQVEADRLQEVMTPLLMGVDVMAQEHTSLTNAGIVNRAEARAERIKNKITSRELTKAPVEELSEQTKSDLALITGHNADATAEAAAGNSI